MNVTSELTSTLCLGLCCSLRKSVSSLGVIPVGIDAMMFSSCFSTANLMAFSKSASGICSRMAAKSLLAVVLEMPWVSITSLADGILPVLAISNAMSLRLASFAFVLLDMCLHLYWKYRSTLFNFEVFEFTTASYRASLYRHMFYIFDVFKLFPEDDGG